MISVCGYNGFHQLLALFRNNATKQLNEHVVAEFCSLNIPSKDIVLCASWNEILFVENTNIKVCGFYNAEPGRCISLTPPFKERVIEAAICKEGYIFVCESGKVWRCSRQDNLWKDLTNNFSAEVVSETYFNKIIKVSCGETLMAALSNSGVAFCGPNALSEVRGVKDVSCGKEHGMLLTDSGMVYTWGGGSRGQLGRGDLDSSESPCEVEALSGLRVVKISAGGWHSAAITEEGDLYTWGWNKQGQLGFPLLSDGVEGSISVQVVPRAVDLPVDDAFIEYVSCGTSHTVIKLRGGGVYGCGWNKWGQLGLGEVRRSDKMTPLPLPAGVSARKLLCGAWTTFILS